MNPRHILGPRLAHVAAIDPRTQPAPRPVTHVPATALDAHMDAVSRPDPINPARIPALREAAWLALSPSVQAPQDARGRFLSRDHIVRQPLPPPGQRQHGVLYVGEGDTTTFTAIRRLGMYVLAWSPRRQWLDSDLASPAHRRYAMLKAWGQQRQAMNGGAWESLDQNQQEAAYAAFRDDNAGWVCLWGDQGTGKTTLAWAAMMTAACYGTVGARHIVTPELVRSLERLGTGGQPSPWETFLHHMRTTQGLVLLDDLAYTQRSQLTEALAERWADVLHARVGLPTLVTCNHDPTGPLGERRSLASQIGGKPAALLLQQCAARYEGDQRILPLLGPSRRT